MSGWWGFALTVGIGVLLGAVQAVHDLWFSDEWVETVEREAKSVGLPPATHSARHWGRTVSIKAVDPDTGEWLWKAHRQGGFDFVEWP